MDESEMTRRALFAAGGLGAAALMTGAAAAAEPQPGPGEQANLRLVQDFCRSWGEAAFDPDRDMPRYLAPDCRVRVLDTQPFLDGPAAVAAAFKAYAPHGERFQVEILSTYARGPIVVTQRIDTEVAGGKPGPRFPVVGVFFLKGGKIQEWTDYVVT